MDENCGTRVKFCNCRIKVIPEEISFWATKKSIVCHFSLSQNQFQIGPRLEGIFTQIPLRNIKAPKLYWGIIFHNLPHYPPLPTWILREASSLLVTQEDTENETKTKQKLYHVRHSHTHIILHSGLLTFNWTWSRNKGGLKMRASNTSPTDWSK